MCATSCSAPRQASTLNRWRIHARWPRRSSTAWKPSRAFMRCRPSSPCNCRAASAWRCSITTMTFGCRPSSETGSACGRSDWPAAPEATLPWAQCPSTRAMPWWWRCWSSSSNGRAQSTPECVICSPTRTPFSQAKGSATNTAAAATRNLWERGGRLSSLPAKRPLLTPLKHSSAPWVCLFALHHWKSRCPPSNWAPSHSANRA